MRISVISWISCLLFSCTSIPKTVQPITGFDVNRYLGTWHEVARLDHSFERGLTQVTATYSKRDDGGIKVVNRGFNEAKSKWKESEGKAYFVGQDTVGHLKVSFFGPFYGSYVIMELDKEDYNYALVCGPDYSYLWMLSRKKELDADVKEMLIEKAKESGFKTEELIWLN
jgi:apolipoprotein D and lipocalin family protein